MNDAVVYISFIYASIYPGEELWGHRVCLSSTLLDITKLFSKVVAPISTPFKLLVISNANDQLTVPLLCKIIASVHVLYIIITNFWVRFY